MIQISPPLPERAPCDCGGQYNFSEYLWQGLHVCRKIICDKCNRVIIESIPVNQSVMEQYRFYPETGTIKNNENKTVTDNWYTEKLKSIGFPNNEVVELEVKILNRFDEVIILNTLDYVYGHSLLFLLNLQRIIENRKTMGIILLVQPMLKWMIPKSDIAEVWTVDLGFNKLNSFYPDLSNKLNQQLVRFKKVYLSKGHLIPTNRNIEIEKFTGIKPYSFSNEPVEPKITFIWREDPDRMWIRNYYLLKGFKKLGISKLLIPFQYFRLIYFSFLINKKLKRKCSFTVAGLGNTFKLPAYINDQRVRSFDEESEKRLCTLYSQSILVIGVHGSSMLLPSVHAGMTISMMPSKRWGNFAEDILFTEQDIRLATFQRRIVPLNLCIFELRDILCEMISGRDYFIKKFIHSEEL
jgi:hypothetical protein